MKIRFRRLNKNNMHRICTSLPVVFILFLFLNNSVVGQTVLLQVDRGIDSIPTKRGPNLKKFSYGFLYFGFVAGADKPGARIHYGSSVDFGAGVRKKYKVSQLYSPGWEFGLNETIFKTKQVAGKLIPDTLLNEVERMEFSAIYVAFYNRFNFDNHRGNYMGTFVDLGISGEWNFSVSHIIKNTLPDGSKIMSVVTHLPYAYAFNSHVVMRIGLSHGLLYIRYRLADYFKSSYRYPELPALTIGMELGIFTN
jgi:hypothetical protein